MDYPEARRGDTCDTLHGHPVADPYRWLEDPDSPETKAWVEAQRRLCEAHLADLETRRHFHERVEELLGQPVLGLPVKVPGGYLVYHHDGASNQPCFLWVRNWRDTEDAEVLLDPNEWSADGTTSVQGLTVSPDGSTLCWVVSEAGSDWTTFHCRDLASGREWEPGVRTKFSFPVYLPDSCSLVVLRFPVEEDGTGAVTAVASDPHLVVVRPDGSVEDLTPGPQEPGTIHWPHVHLDRDAEGRPTGTGWLVDTLTVGTAHDNRIRVWPLTTEDGLTRVGEAADLVDGTEARHRVVGVEGDGLYLLTDDSGDTDRLVRVDLRRLGEGPAELCEILPAEDDPVADADLAGGRLVVLRTVDVSPQVSLHELDGTLVRRHDLAGGEARLSAAEDGSPEVFIGLSTPSRCLDRHRLDTDTGELEKLPGGTCQDYAPQVERRRATSADGTAVPYWFIHLPGARGPLPTIVHGYGGFGVAVTNTWSAAWQAWVEAGGAVAVVNSRGGGEFGRAWYQAGIRDHKQNVFDDHIGVLEDLISRGDATPQTLAVNGRSNGGLLVGALLTQRPDLMAAAVPEVGVLDLLRFHKFTSGAAWASDYGNPDDPHDFEVELAYSPLHNVREGVDHPAVLVMTGDHDDRVVPAHSHKFTATLQHAQGGHAPVDGQGRVRPVLTRVEASTGHGAGRPHSMVVDALADKLAFIARHTGMVPPSRS